MKSTNIVRVKNIEGNATTTAYIVAMANINYIPKISVIIPVYNVGQYLRQCLDSIINQTLPEIEIICVDDGSTDDSPEILKEYAARYPHVTVLQQKNLHAGIARNAGIAVAKGEYLHFMDADDYLFDDNVYENLYETAKHADFCNIIRGKAKGFDCNSEEYVYNKWYERDDLPPELNNTFISAFSQTDILVKLSVVPWMGIIRRDFVLHNNLRFNNLRCCNDRSFFMTSCVMADKIFLTDIYMVSHRVNNSASLRGLRDKFFDCHFKSIQIIHDFMTKHHIEENTAKEIMAMEMADMAGFFRKYFFESPYSREIYVGTLKFLKKHNPAALKPYICQYPNYELLCSLARHKRFGRLYYQKDKTELADRNNWVDERGHRRHPIAEKVSYKVFGLPLFTKYKMLNGTQKKYCVLGLPILNIGNRITE